MHFFRTLPAAVLGLSSLLFSVAHAGDCQPRVREAWLRLPPGPAAMMLAGFGRIDNGCDSPVGIVGVASPAFGAASLHETRLVDGVSRMRAVGTLPLAAGATATLQPGGLHLMLMGPKRPLQAGDRVPLEFRLADGRVLRADAEVRKLVP